MLLAVLLVRCLFGFWAVSPDALDTSFCADPDEKITITVVTILATTHNDTVDEKLKEIAREVQKKEPELTGFRLATTTCRTITFGVRETFPSIDEHEVVVEAKNCTDKVGRVCLKVKAPTLSCLSYTCACGKYFPVVTGYETKNGERLIIAVMVEAAKGK